MFAYFRFVVFVSGVYCTILIRIFFVSYHVLRIGSSLDLRSFLPAQWPSSCETMILRGCFRWVNFGKIHRLFSPTSLRSSHSRSGQSEPTGCFLIRTWNALQTVCGRCQVTLSPLSATTPTISTRALKTTKNGGNVRNRDPPK